MFEKLLMWEKLYPGIDEEILTGPLFFWKMNVFSVSEKRCVSSSWELSRVNSA